MAAWAARLTLAYALVLQVVAGSAAASMHAGVGALGSSVILCMPSKGAPDAPGEQHPAERQAQALCCVLGCAAAQPMPALSDTAQWDAGPPADSGARLLSDASRAEGQAASPAFRARGPPAGR